MSLKTENDIWNMRKAGLLTWCGQKLVSEIIKSGMTTRQLDAEVDRLFVSNRAIPLFKGVPGKVPYPATTCISVNNQVVHGIPGDRVILDGDIVTVDSGCKIDGWCGDSADTYLIGNVSEESKRLVKVTRDVLALAIKLIPRKKRWSAVAKEMQEYVRQNGFSMVEAYVGHGIGRSMHEEPQVPNYVFPSYLRRGDFDLVPGVVIAIEPIVNVGSKKVREGGDHWTILTLDGKNSANAEHTVAITKEGPFILTGPPTDSEENGLVESFFDTYRRSKNSVE